MSEKEHNGLILYVGNLISDSRFYICSATSHSGDILGGGKCYEEDLEDSLKKVGKGFAELLLKENVLHYDVINGENFYFGNRIVSTVGLNVASLESLIRNIKDNL